MCTKKLEVLDLLPRQKKKIEMNKEISATE